MASLYDILTVDGKKNYRLDKNLVDEKDVPTAVRDLLTPENVVDENAMIVVDNKSTEAQAPTEDNLKELKAAKAGESNAAPTAGSEENSENKTPEQQIKDAADGSENDDSTEDSEEGGEDTTSDESDVSDDEDETEQQDDEKPAEKAPEQPARAPEPKPQVGTFRSKVPQSHPGMGFPRVNGKTVDLFDGQTPHTHVKNVGGFAVPLSEHNFRVKNDSEIITRLKELGMSPVDFTELERERDEATSPSLAGNMRTGGSNGMLLDDSESDDTPSH